MDMQFTLKEIENTYDDAKNYVEVYQNAVDELDKLINELSQSWISNETKTYETFYSNYKDNYTKLIKMQQMMKNFCDKLEIKKQELSEMAKSINNKFE